MNNVDKHAKNKNNIILIITIVAIVLLLIGGAYGYFKTKTDDGGFSNKREYTKTGQHMKTDLNTYLNGEWLTTLEEAIGTDKIAEVQWQIGGINWNNYLNKTVPEVYKLELDPTSINTYPNEEYINLSPTKIGLMYVSDDPGTISCNSVCVRCVYCLLYLRQQCE